MSEYTAYQSPIDFIRLLGLEIKDLDQESIALKKKELLLEIQLKEKQFIKIDGTEYTKNDILQLFDRLSDLEEVSFHRKIAENEHLQRFLTTQTLPTYGAFVDNLYFDYDDTESFEMFKQKISPYFAYALNRAMSGVLAQSHYKRLMLLEPFFELLEPADFRYAFKKFTHFNTELQAHVLLLNPLDNKFDWKKYKHLDSPELYQLANFVDLEIINFAEKLAISLVNLTVHYQRYPGRKDYLVKLMEHAQTLNCSKNVKEVITNNLRAFKTTVEKKELVSTSTSIVKIFTLLALFGLVVFVFSKIINVSYPEAESQYRYRQKDFSNTPPPAVTQNSYNFNYASFQELHSKLYSDLSQDSLVQFTGSSTPSFSSPFEHFDTNLRILHMNQGAILNQTRFDLLLVQYSANGLRGHHIPAYGRIPLRIKPTDEFFIYSGSDWSNDKGVEYSYFSSTKNRTFWMAIEGHFREFSSANLNLMQYRYSIPMGRADNLSINEQGDQIILSYNGKTLKGL